MASWVQAFGSIAAILIAVFIAGRDSRLRRRAERDARRGAIDRAIIAVNDAGMRLSGAIDTIDVYGARDDVLAFIETDLGQSQEHLKEILSIHGIDGSIYSQIFVTRTAVESAGHIFRVLATISDSDEYEIRKAKESLVHIMTAYDSLELLKKAT
jgi:hypothetical protein